MMSRLQTIVLAMVLALVVLAAGPASNTAEANTCASCHDQYNQCRIATRDSPSCRAALQACLKACLKR